MLGYNLVSRFHSDDSLKYLYTGPMTGKKGRPKVVDVKVVLSAYTEMSAKDIIYLQNKVPDRVPAERQQYYTYLTRCQSRQKETFAYHFNMFLVAIKVARIFARQN